MNTPDIWRPAAGRACIVGLLALLGGLPVAAALPDPAAISPAPSLPLIEEPPTAPSLFPGPPVFEPNRGQSDPRVLFLSRVGRDLLFLTAREAVLVLAEAGGEKAVEGARPVVRMELAGASTAPRVTGVGELAGRSHYLRGGDRRGWVRNVPHYGSVRYESVYEGVDLVYRTDEGHLEYDFIVAPGADPRAIRMRFRGADDLRLDEDGNLIIQVADARVVHRAPRIYQEDEGHREFVPGGYVLRRGNRVRLRIEKYDRSRPLVIDPQVVVYSTYFGASESSGGALLPDEDAAGIAVDRSGAAHLVGRTSSADFPFFLGVFQPTFGGTHDAYVAKILPDGSGLAYVTYIGGPGGDGGTGIALTDTGEVVVTGWTHGSFPVSPGSFDTGHNGAEDAFVAKLRSDGSDVVYSAYLGGSSDDRGRAVAVNAAGDAYVTGSTMSVTDFPIVSAFQPAAGGNEFSTDAFVARVSADGSVLQFSSYLGGDLNDWGYGIAVDPWNNAHVTGSTNSSDFPTTPGAFQPTLTDDGNPSGVLPDAFVVKVQRDGLDLIYGTYLGGDGRDSGQGIAIDGSTGRAYVTGVTERNFPTTLGALKPFCANDAFVTVLAVDGCCLTYSDCVGGSFDEEGRGIAVDGAGNAYVTGWTDSPDFPARDPVQGYGGLEDAFLTVLDLSTVGPLFSSFLGGSLNDHGAGVALGPVRDTYVTGWTESANFPTRAPLQPALVGRDGFATKFSYELRLSAEPDRISWIDEIGAEKYDAVFGSLGIMRGTGSMMAASLGCLGEDYPDTEIQLNDQVNVGEGLWYLVRPIFGLLDGSYGVGASETGTRDDEIDLSQLACEPGCDHDSCVEGGPLDAACDACVAQVCAADSFCCDTGWDSQCIEEVRTICSSLRCPEARGVCAHGLCSIGLELSGGCDSPPAQTSCVDVVCQTNPDCCQVEWDADCVDALATACSMGCD